MGVIRFHAEILLHCVGDGKLLLVLLPVKSTKREANPGDRFTKALDALKLRENLTRLG
jgi:hypothetical protein